MTVDFSQTDGILTPSHVLVIIHADMSNVATGFGVQKDAFGQVDKCQRLVENNFGEQSTLCWSGHRL